MSSLEYTIFSSPRYYSVNIHIQNGKETLKKIQIPRPIATGSSQTLWQWALLDNPPFDV